MNGHRQWDPMEEYRQASQDWRHRDAMLWQSLAVSIAVTAGITRLYMGAEPSFKVILALLSLAMNILLLLKITRDHYFQTGSQDVMIDIANRHGKSLLAEKRLRAPEPSKVDTKNILLPGVYLRLSQVSAFKYFYLAQISLFFFSAFLVLLVSRFAAAVVAALLMYLWFRSDPRKAGPRAHRGRERHGMKGPE